EMTVATVEAEMLGGDTGRMRRERWAERLDAGRKHDCNIAASFRAANREGPRQDRVQGLLEAFFKENGEGNPRGGENDTVTTKDMARADPSLEDDLRREQ